MAKIIQFPEKSEYDIMRSSEVISSTRDNRTYKLKLEPYANG